MTDGYDLDASAPDVVALQAAFQARSDKAANLPGARLDLAYGSHPRHWMDVFSAGSDAPTLVFFHGGFWKAGSKDARRFPAPVWLARDVSWVCVNYRLVPEFGLADCVDDARAAVAWIAENAEGLKLDPDRLHVTGNSAGAHLAAMVAAADAETSGLVKSLAVVSGLFDLAPLTRARTNEWLRLSESDARGLSPSNHLCPRELPVLVGFGGAETEAFKSQSRGFARACLDAGNPVEVFQSPGADHFQIIGEYGTPGTLLFEHLTRLVTA